MSTKTVYWSPAIEHEDDIHNCNIMFLEPDKLLNKINNDISDRNGERIKLLPKCPAFTNLAKNTYYVENPISTEFKIENKQINFISENSNMITYGDDTIVYGNNYIFFCEDDLQIMLTSPFFSETNYTNYGIVIPGKFNISKWFRPINLEMLLINERNYFKIKEHEHMAYFTFLTDDKVELKRFNLNKTLKKIANTCATSNEWWKNIPLIKKYDRFVKTKTNKLVIKEIKKELVE